MPHSGKNGYVLVGGVARAFNTWEYVIDADDPDVTNWTSAGKKRQTVPGVERFSMKCKGPLEWGGNNLTRGTIYTVALGVDEGLFYTGPARLKSISVSNDMKGAPQLDVTFESTGDFVTTVA